MPKIPKKTDHTPGPTHAIKTSNDKGMNRLDRKGLLATYVYVTSKQYQATRSPADSAFSFKTFCPSAHGWLVMMEKASDLYP